MIYGEIETDKSYFAFYDELLAYVKKNFKDVESGFQGDAYIWIKNPNGKVSLDTFTSMRFEIKSDKNNGTLVQDVIKTLQKQYPLSLCTKAELEAHE